MSPYYPATEGDLKWPPMDGMRRALVPGMTTSIILRLCLNLIICITTGCGDDVPFDQGADAKSADVDGTAIDLLGATDVDVSHRHRIFLFRNGALGKILDSSSLEKRAALEVADGKCGAEAARRGYDGSWKAWLSSSELSVVDRITTDGPWYRADRETLLFGNKSEFLIGPRVTIEGIEDPSELQFWSGTDRLGRPTDHTCDDWSEYVHLLGTVNRADRVGADWWVDAPIDCGNYLALLCIED